MGLDREKLVKCLGMLGSDSDGEAMNALRAATKLVDDAGLSWDDVVVRQGERGSNGSRSRRRRAGPGGRRRTAGDAAGARGNEDDASHHAVIMEQMVKVEGGLGSLDEELRDGFIELRDSWIEAGGLTAAQNRRLEYMARLVDDARARQASYAAYGGDVPF